jgi:hypothetical protein
MHQLSLIVDPADGQFPELTDYGKKLQAEMKSSYKQGQTVFDAIEDFSAWDRCITRGMPVSMEPRNYNNGIRIMQSPGYVMILVEMAHEVRVVPTSGMPPLDSGIKEWLGESRGHWEGNTLVVETTNFLGGKTGIGLNGGGTPTTDALKLTERYERTGPNEIRYDVTIDDPKTYVRPFKVAFPLTQEPGYQNFEYACHEGNYAMFDSLSGARAQEKRAAEAAAKK